jgi:hypothetical protein
MTVRTAGRYAGKAMKFLRITDENGLLSLTNLTMMIVMYHMLTVDAISIKELTGLAIGVLGYQGKRGLGGKMR